jgi:hypothetical protein
MNDSNIEEFKSKKNINDINKDNFRYNKIEDALRTKKIKDISTDDLIYYLYINTNNEELNNSNNKKLQNYFFKINYSYFFENIFTNTSNYTTVSIYLIGLLIPFYINYPRFYNLGTIGFFIGLISFMLIYQHIHTTFGVFFPNASRLFIILSTVLYFIFFPLLNKLNHISLFFLTCIVSFVIINYIYRILLTWPSKNNIYNKLNVTYKDDKNYVEYNDLNENVCAEIIKRFNLNLPSNRMLYSYLTVFKIEDNKNKISDFCTNLFYPFLSLFYISSLSYFLNNLSIDYLEKNKIKPVPIIGLTELSKNYSSCQANYVLPIEYNYHLFMKEYYNEDKLDDVAYSYLTKTLKRISNDLIQSYQPLFTNFYDIKEDELEDHISIQSNIKNNDNHILIQIKKLFKKYKLKIPENDNKNNYIEKLYSIIKNESLPYKEKMDAYNLLEKINVTLKVQTNKNNKENSNLNNQNIDNNIKLAIEVLLEHEKVKPEYKKYLKELCINYGEYLKKNLQDNTLYGFNYNLLTYKFFNNKSTQKANKCFSWVLKLLSTYILLSRPISSPWIFSNLLLLNESTINSYIKTYGNSISSMSKYISMGLDTEYFKGIYENTSNNSFLTTSTKLLYKIILFMFVSLPFLQFFNNTIYGMTLNPSYYNLIYIVIFIINLLFLLYLKKPFGMSKIGFIIAYFIFILLISTILYMIYK